MAKTGDKRQLEKLYNNYEINLNNENEDQYTALHWSARNGHLDVVKFLVEQGAHITLKGYEQKTALAWAKENGHHDIAKYLVEKEA